MPSEIDQFKLSVDDAWTMDGVGIGRLIRDHLGRVHIPFTTALAHSHSPEHVETIAIHKGLHLLKDLATPNSFLKAVVKLLLISS